MQFKKGILMPLVLAIVGIFVSVAAFVMIQVSSKVSGTTTGPAPLAIFGLVFSVLYLSALSAKKPLFTKIVNIIAVSSLVLTAFIVSIVASADFQIFAVTWDSITFLTLSILSLVSMILFLIYFLIGKKDTLKKLSYVLNIFSIVFFGLFAAALVVSSFVGLFKNQVLYGLELAVLLVDVCIILGIVLSLQNNLEPKE